MFLVAAGFTLLIVVAVDLLLVAVDLILVAVAVDLVLLLVAGGLRFQEAHRFTHGV